MLVGFRDTTKTRPGIQKISELQRLQRKLQQLQREVRALVNLGNTLRIFNEGLGFIWCSKFILEEWVSTPHSVAKGTNTSDERNLQSLIWVTLWTYGGHIGAPGQAAQSLNGHCYIKLRSMPTAENSHRQDLILRKKRPTIVCQLCFKLRHHLFLFYNSFMVHNTRLY
ncbi:uncharacterized protein LOC111258337 [Setaria italica]|uniref:uncharacterized protein LOC111258337 n=1 Tax=Setaria italica TaxID=4555 RepID=UPI000BE50B33|nr:uncharacterized protein LOC111258337 [Setaria italica]